MSLLRRALQWGSWRRCAGAFFVSIIVSTLVVPPAAAQRKYGGAAPPPSCNVGSRKDPFGNVCKPEAWESPAAAAVQTWCDRYADSHRSNGGGPHEGGAFCWERGSNVLSCSMANPPVPTNNAGSNSANVNTLLSAQDTVANNWGSGPVYYKWSGAYNGPLCSCPGNSVITEQATCACPEGKEWWDPLESTCRHASLSIL